MEALSEVERRRRARQRKILENSQSRMNRLYGRTDTAEATADKDRVQPAEPCPDPPDQTIDEVLGPGRWPPPAAGVEELLRQMNGRPGPEAAAAAAERRGSVVGGGRRWLLVVLLAALVRLTIGATPLTQSVLLPFLVLQTALYAVQLWSAPLGSNLGLLGTALMLCGVSARALDLWGRYFAFLHQAWNDFMVYMFVIVLCFAGGGARSLATAAATANSADGSQMAAPPPLSDDHLQFEF